MNEIMDTWEERETLTLTIKKEWFDVMKTGEKIIEIRKPSKWLMSRIHKKLYQRILFRNGYRKDSPYFIAEYMGYATQIEYATHIFSNGSTVSSEPGDIIIFIGKILKRK